MQRTYADSDSVEDKAISKSTFGSIVYIGRGVVEWTFKTQRDVTPKGEQLHFDSKQRETVKVCKVPYGLECSLRTWRMSACTLLQSRAGRLPEGSQDSTLSPDSTLFKTLLCTNMLRLWNAD